MPTAFGPPLPSDEMPPRNPRVSFSFGIACFVPLTTPPARDGEPILMYDMYPEWDPAHLNDEAASSSSNWPGPVQESLDLRDHGGERPDDN